MATNETPKTNDEIDAQPRANQLVRRGFDAMTMAHENAATQALVAKATADVQARFIMAMRCPRDPLQVRMTIMKECDRPGFAEAAIYKLPRGGKTITGLTIRFAEVAMRATGNMSCDAQTLYDSDEERVVRVTTTDYESNSTWNRDVTIKKTKETKTLKAGERPIRQRLNSSGEVTYLVPATDDDMRMKEGAEISRAARTAILRLIPGHIQDEAEAKCMHIMQLSAAERLAKDPDGEKNRMLEAFSQIDVMPVDVARLLGHDLSRITPAELTDLRLTYQAIMAGEASVADALAAADARHAKKATEKPANGNGQASQSHAGATATPPKPTAQGGKGAAATKDKIKTEQSRGAAKPEPKVEPKPEPEKPTETTAVEPTSAPVKDGYEERKCADCGVVIEVPIGDPVGAQCYACANS